MLGEILLGVRPVLARMPEIPCVFWGPRTLNEYDDDDEVWLSILCYWEEAIHTHD